MTRQLRGREAEERQITRMLQAVAAGASSVLHVEGGWGSGRTRLLREAADLAGRLGFSVVDGVWPAGAVPGALDAPEPVLVVLDDLHHADVEMLDGLRVLPWQLRDRPIAWILSRRRHAGGAAADRLFTRPCPAVDLGPLPAPAVQRLVADHAAGAVPPDLMQMTGGNALLAVELARGMRADHSHGVLDRPPERVRSCVRRCLTELSDLCRRLLQVGAVLGPCFPLSDATRLLRRPAADLIGPVEEALAADVLACDEECLVFPQELFWRCVLSSLPHPARAALAQEAAGEHPAPAAIPRVNACRDAARSEERSPALSVRLPVTVRQAAGWTDLSEAERAVALLASQGLTNQQIASRVSRSPHTVNYHLRRIFKKLGIRSRIELARLTPPPYSAGVLDAAG
ncbi:LuxR C-terminal-related transcriptional regulator [Nonomuraea sp. NPDC049421]|uniref:helix-turn-helix transcriptional regulator n=1 Tax=Nonomuraea sp. NPDC049421 TaxID=3155275 RepID=UPI00342E9169